MVSSRMYLEYILFIMFVLGQHQKSIKNVCIVKLQEITEIVSITVTKKVHMLSQTLKCHKTSLQKFSQKG